MGAVFSVLYSVRLFAERILTWGEAASAGAFRSFTRDYCISLQTILPLCEDSEPCEDFSDVIKELEVEEIAIPSACDSYASQVPRLEMQRSSGSPLQNTSQIEEQSKRLYRLAANEARKEALRFRRRFDLYGPPDWDDPALAVLPSTMLLPESCCCGVIPSPYPFLAPHIVISPPMLPNVPPAIAWTNSLHCQDHDNGNRLIVAQAPSMDGPLPLVINSMLQNVFATVESTAEPSLAGPPSASQACSVPAIKLNFDNASGSGSSEYPTDDCSRDEVLLLADKETCPQSVTSQLPASTFWIEEDEDDLPELPANW